MKKILAVVIGFGLVACGDGTEQYDEPGDMIDEVGVSQDLGEGKARPPSGGPCECVGTRSAYTWGGVAYYSESWYRLNTSITSMTACTPYCYNEMATDISDDCSGVPDGYAHIISRGKIGTSYGPAQEVINECTLNPNP